MVSARRAKILAENPLVSMNGAAEIQPRPDQIPGERREMRMASHFFRRRNFVPNPRFQFLLAGKGVSYVFLYGAVIVYTTLQSMAETMYILPLNCLTPEVKARIWAFPTEALLLSLLIALVV